MFDIAMRHLLGRKLVGLTVLLAVMAIWPGVANQQIVGCNTQEVTKTKINKAGVKITYTGYKDACELDDLLDLPVKIFDVLIGLAGIVLLLVIVWSGFRMLLYYASDMPEGELQAAKNTLRNGVTGFVIVVGAYLIVHVLLFQVLDLDSTSDVGTELIKRGIKK